MFWQTDGLVPRSLRMKSGNTKLTFTNILLDLTSSKIIFSSIWIFFHEHSDSQNSRRRGRLSPWLLSTNSTCFTDTYCTKLPVGLERGTFNSERKSPSTKLVQYFKVLRVFKQICVFDSLQESNFYQVEQINQTNVQEYRNCPQDIKTSKYFWEKKICFR